MVLAKVLRATLFIYSQTRGNVLFDSLEWGGRPANRALLLAEQLLHTAVQNKFRKSVSALNGVAAAQALLVRPPSSAEKPSHAFPGHAQGLDGMA